MAIIIIVNIAIFIVFSKGLESYVANNIIENQNIKNGI